MTRREAADTVAIERVDDQNNDGKINESENEQRVGCEQRGAA